MVCGERFHIGLDIMQETCGDWQGRVAQDFIRCKHAVQKCPTGTAVSVGERMDGLELRVEQGCLGNGGDVVSLSKGNEIVQARTHPV